MNEILKYVDTLTQLIRRLKGSDNNLKSIHFIFWQEDGWTTAVLIYLYLDNPSLPSSVCDRALLL